MKKSVLFLVSTSLMVTGACATGGNLSRTEPAIPVAYAPYEARFSDDSTLAAQLGIFSVPENRDAPNSRTIEIKFVRFPTTASSPRDPIVYLAGGPGSGGTEILRGPRGLVLARLRSVADVIVLDQRGTGLSNAIPTCTPQETLPPDQLTGSSIAAHYRTQFARCLENWRAAGVDPRGYNLADSARDLDDLRRGLGVRRLNLLGLSYGPQLGMAFMQMFPNSTACAVLASPRGLQQTVRLPSQIDAFLTRVGGPDLVALMRRVHRSLDERPVTVAITPRDGAAPVTIRFDSFAVRYMVSFFFLNGKDGTDRLPLLYRQMDEGNFAEIGRTILENGLHPQRGRFVAFRGMGEIMDVSSGIPPQRMATWRAQVRGSVLGDAHNFPIPQALGVGGLSIPRDLMAPTRTSVPTLLISGTHDGRTPIESVAEILPVFTRRERLIVPEGGHNILEFNDSVGAAVGRFFETCGA